MGAKFCPIASTLAYILSPDREKVLLVHRTFKEGDENLGKYNGVGGKLERGETVADGMRREIREETGLEVVSMQLRGTIVWTDFGPSKADWLAFVFLVDAFSGEPFTASDEGRLSWEPVRTLDALPMWKGDRLFLPFVFDGDPRLFHGHIRYDGDDPADWRFTR
jgi:8-oxo-dGTP diphosphatase